MAGSDLSKAVAGMDDRLKEIRKSIDAFQMERARKLVDEALAENPDAETYYLASQAAINHGQRMEFLQKALEYDPGFQVAADELAAIMPEQNIEPAPAARDTAPAPVMPKLASVGKRWLAILIDGIIVAIPTLMLIGVTGMAANLETAVQANDSAMVSAAFSQFQSDLLLLNILISAVYNVFFMVYFNGQTLGKIMLGLRVVKKNGRRISWLDALLRNVFGYTVSGLFLLGYIWAIFDREKQAWHDKMAGTVVVDERNRVASKGSDQRAEIHSN